MRLQDAQQVVPGVLFGVALTASGVFLPSVIIKQLELKDFYMLQSSQLQLVMLAFDTLGVVQRPVRPNSPLGPRWAYGGNLLGGVMAGIGMSLTGACPGTVLVQLAQRIQSAKPVAIGALLGGMAYSYVSPMLSPLLRPRGTCTTKVTVSQASRLSDGMAYLLLLTFIIVPLATSHKLLHASGSCFSPGGLAIGATQAVSLLLTSNPIGVSTAYEDGGRCLLQVLHMDRAWKPIRATKAMIFAVSMMAGSAGLTALVDLPRLSPAGVIIPFWQAFTGGFVMVFGARLSGGCTSGHGISGVSALSFSSFVTLAGMFGAGILSRLFVSAMMKA